MAIIAVLAPCSWLPHCAKGAELPLAAPPGFEVSLYADDSLAHDIFSMTVDAQGHVVVAGPGYVKILHDDDHDGRADRAQLFSSKPASGAHGMLFLGADLLCTGDNAVMRLTDADGDGVADGEPEIWAQLRHSEHGANGLARGPDGWIYLVTGNDAGVSEKNATTETSPIKQPQCGAVVRFSPDGRQQEIVADGFRNPYDLDFNPAGQLFTVDSDGERDYHLPWYAPTRLFDVAQGCGHGWLLSGSQRSWNRPQSFFDAVERLVEIGRGSPTGVVCYRHRQFPAHYRGGIFSACWTLGRVYYFPLEPSGSTYASRCETFLETTGEIGFAPCDLAVGPAGDLFIAIGGRRTQGSVFRVRYVGPESRPLEAPAGELEQVLAADQPLAAWSRARWLPLAEKLGRVAFERAALEDGRPISQRIRAVEILVDCFAGVNSQIAEAAIAGGEKPLVARIAWALGRGEMNGTAARLLAKITASDDPPAERAAWEALSAMSKDATKGVTPDWSRGLNSTDRRVRTAAILAAGGGCSVSYHEHVRRQNQDKKPVPIAENLAWPRTGSCTSLAPFCETCLQYFAESKTPSLREETIRLLQIGLGDLHIQPGDAEVFSGYRAAALDRVDAALRQKIVDALAPAFPTDDAELNRELARLLGMFDVENPQLVDALSRQWTSQSRSEDDIHYFIVSALVGGARSPEVTARTAGALLDLENKLRRAGGHPSQNWPLRVAEAFDALCQRDAALAEQLADDSAFGRPEHTLYASRLKGPLRERATRKLLAAASTSEESLSSELIALIAQLPAAESLPALRGAWDDVGVRDAVLSALARHAQAEDRQRFVEALASVQPKVAQQAANALAKLGATATPVEIRRAMAALAQACLAPEQKELRAALLDLLGRWSGGALKIDLDSEREPAAQWAAALRWFAAAYPDEAQLLAAGGAADAAEWQRRLSAIDWSTADPQRGRVVFERKACHRCHLASGQLGPELTGAVGRMSREDLLTAIIDPNKEVSPTYQTTRIVTTAGQVYYGLLVYESPEATLLQTSPDTTLRIIGAERSDMQPVRQSLMPTGLLNGVTDQELGDLLAFLKTLASKGGDKASDAKSAAGKPLGNR